MNTVIGKEIYAGAACANFMQSPEWADVKAGWKHEYVTAERGGAVAGSMLIDWYNSLQSASAASLLL